MNVEILFRQSKDTVEELRVARRYFSVRESRMSLKSDALIIPRYSALPYYEELDRDAGIIGSRLINSTEMHRYIADFSYYEDIAPLTFPSWNLMEFFSSGERKNNRQYIVKGATNSHKWEWSKKMFAANAKEAEALAWAIHSDEHMAQEPIIRLYEPLKADEIGVGGIPFANEWRFFFLGRNILSCGYYWSCAENKPEHMPHEALTIALEAARIISQKVNFFVVDVAEKVDGDWTVVEINDGQQAGPSECSTDLLYKNLSFFLSSKNPFPLL